MREEDEFLEQLCKANRLEDVKWAFLGSMRWIEALALLCDNGSFNHPQLRAFYQEKVGGNQKQPEEAQINSLYNLLMSLHFLSGLQSANNLQNQFTLSRANIISWYYSIYFSCKSIVLAHENQESKNHKNAREQLKNVVKKQYLVYPFDLFVDDLRKESIKETVSTLRQGITFDLGKRAYDEDSAHGVICSYLKGNCDYWKEHTQEEIKKRKDFNFEDFRTKSAQKIRDDSLRTKHVNFLTQAYRFRGKANY